MLHEKGIQEGTGLQKNDLRKRSAKKICEKQICKKRISTVQQNTRRRWKAAGKDNRNN